MAKHLPFYDKTNLTGKGAATLVISSISVCQDPTFLGRDSRKTHRKSCGTIVEVEGTDSDHCRFTVDNCSQGTFERKTKLIENKD